MGNTAPLQKLRDTLQAIREFRAAQANAEAAYLEEFGTTLRRVREQKGLTQNDLAELSGLTRTSIANMEAGRQDTTIGTLVRIAMALECEPSELLPSTAPGGAQ